MENIMKAQLIKAARMHAQGELERAKTNIMVYMDKSVGIGEHSDIVEAIQKELDTMAVANDRIEMLDKFFGDASSSMPLFENQ
tara:strand:- start:9257 stop:9505 length:249 start_codon:yes stop_codon:yes gene_type:complete